MGLHFYGKFRKIWFVSLPIIAMCRGGSAAMTEVAIDNSVTQCIIILLDNLCTLNLLVLVQTTMYKNRIQLFNCLYIQSFIMTSAYIVLIIIYLNLSRDMTMKLYKNPIMKTLKLLVEHPLLGER